MEIIYKCSFRSSNGFRIGKYNAETKQLSYISEKSAEIKKALPDTVAYTLSHELGRCLFLAADENGDCFLGMYRLIEGNDDKYVNAVFYDPDNPRYIAALYEYFCSHQKSASTLLLNSIQRASSGEYSQSGLEFTVQPEIIKKLLNDALSSCPEADIKKADPNSVLAFISAYNYYDFQNTIESKFNVKKMFLRENCNMDDETIVKYQPAAEKPAVPRPVVYGGGGALLAALIAFLIWLFSGGQS